MTDAANDLTNDRNPPQFPVPAEDFRHTLHRLERIYAVALVAVLVILMFIFYVKESRTSLALQDAAVINTAGRQRMISQRLLYLTSQNGRRDVDALAEERAMLNIFDRTHVKLSALAKSDATTDLVYRGTTRTEGLDDAVTRFVAAGRAAVANPTDAVALARFQTTADEDFLFQLESAVAAFENASKARVQNLLTMERLATLGAILAVLAEAGLVFIPGQKSLATIINRLDRRNRDLADLTSRLKIKRSKLAVQADDLHTALRQSEGLRKEQLAFTYGVSHDLKSPSNTIAMVLTELTELNQSPVDEDMRELIDIAANATKRMSQMIEDVLTFGQVANSKMDCDWVDLTKIVAEVSADLGAALAQTGARVSGGGTVWAQPNQLRMLIQNLISNAIKFHEAVRTPEVVISTEISRKPHALDIKVRDNGISIPPEHRQRVLELFQRLHSQKQYEGTGIGLALCDRIARNHGGHIWFQDHDGPGITVVATIALQPQPARHDHPDHEMRAVV